MRVTMRQPETTRQAPPPPSAVAMAVSQQVSKGREKPATSPTPEPTQQETAWLTTMLNRGKNERFTLPTVVITPGLATAMLKYNIHNRRLQEHRVGMFARLMARDEFLLTHQGISFAKTMVLNDGQTRLAGIARCGKPQRMQVTFGAEREEFDAVDTGSKRSTAQLLHMHGLDNSAIRASIARNILLASHEMSRDDTSQIVDFAVEVSKDTKMQAALKIANGVKGLAPPTAFGLAYYWIATRTAHANRVDAFFTGMATGEGLTRPRLSLREWFRKGEFPSQAINTGDRNIYMASVIVNCWNAWIEGRRTFLYTSEGRTTLPDPI